MTQVTRFGSTVPPLQKALGYDPGIIDDEVDAEDPPNLAVDPPGAAIEVPLEVTISDPIEDVNLTDGTVTDGGGSFTFSTPERANDGNPVTNANGTTGIATGTVTRRLKTDLGSAFLIDSMVIDGHYAGGDPGWQVWHSPDGSAWTEITSLSYSWDAGAKVATVGFTPTSDRWWRIGWEVNFGGGFHFIPEVRVYTWAIGGESVISTGFIYVPAPEVVDGNDATYAEVLLADDDAIMRAFLASTFRIGRVILKIGAAAAGSRTIDLYADDSPTFGTEVLIATVTYTATGSYTLDTVTFLPDGLLAYQSYRWKSTDDVRIYELEMYAPVSGGASTAEDVSYDNTTSGLTADDVQEAIDELAVADEKFLWKTEGGGDTIQAHGSMGSTETFDPTGGNVHTGTLTADCTVTLNAPAADPGGACTLELALSQDGTGGWDITWPGSVTVVGTLDTTASTTSLVMLQTLDGGGSWTALVVGGGGGGGSPIALKEDGTTRTSSMTVLNVRHGLDADSSGNVDVDESELTHNSIGGLTTGDPHTQYRLESDQVPASEVSVADAGGHFTGTDVEAVLDELAGGAISTSVPPVIRAAAKIYATRTLF